MKAVENFGNQQPQQRQARGAARSVQPLVLVQRSAHRLRDQTARSARTNERVNGCARESHTEERAPPRCANRRMQQAQPATKGQPGSASKLRAATRPCREDALVRGLAVELAHRPVVVHRLGPVASVPGLVVRAATTTTRRRHQQRSVIDNKQQDRAERRRSERG